VMAGWRDRADPDYRRMRQLVERRSLRNGSTMSAGTCGHEHCQCDSCWVRLKNRQETDNGTTKDTKDTKR